jgi:hypothetical protein
MAEAMRGAVLRMVTSLSLVVIAALGAGFSRAAEAPTEAPPPLELPVCEASNLPRCSATIGGLTVLHLEKNFYMIAGDGENIGVQIGQDGVLVVNAGTEPGAPGLLSVLRRLSPRTIPFLIDTNADLEVVGGNAALAAASSSDAGGVEQGLGRPPATLIIANDSVFRRMAQTTSGPAAYPYAALPNNPFSMDLNPYGLFVNDEPIVISDQPAASSDADSFVLFRRSNVVMAGDVMDMSRFPVIDLAHGGSIDGEINALTNLRNLAVGPVPYVQEYVGTLVVPAHGRVCNQWDVIDYRNMMVIIRDTVAYMMKQHMSLKQIEAARPARGWEPLYGSDSGPWTTNMFIKAIYTSLQAEKKLHR